VAWWRGESNILDSVDSNAGVTAGSVTFTNGIAGKAFQFLDGYVRIPASSNLNIGQGPGLTIEGWVWPKSSKFTNLYLPSREFVGWHSDNSTQAVSLSFRYLNPNTSAAMWDVNLGDVVGRPHRFQSPSLAIPNFWQHVAVTY